MQECDDTVFGAHQRICVILDVMIPETVIDKALYIPELAREKTQQIEHVYTLIKQDPSAHTAFGPPIGFETDDLRFAIDASQIDYFPEIARLYQCQRVTHR